MKKFLGIFASLLLLVSCSGKISYKPLKDMPVQPSYAVDFPTDDSLRFSLDFNQTQKAGKNKKSFPQQIDGIGAVIYANDSRLDSIVTNDLTVNSVPFGSNKVAHNLSAVLAWKKPGYINSNLLNFNLEVRTPKVIYTGMVNIQDIAANNESQAPRRAVTVTPSYVVSSDSVFDFVLASKRNFTDDKEYIPNSEVIRLEIFNSNGERIYFSNKGMNHFQVIKHVLPDEIGRTYEYRVSWNRRTNSGDIIPRGKYTARLTIPSRPMPYSADLDFEY